MEQLKPVSSMGQERQKLLRMLGWEHGKHLPQLAIALLIWHFGSINGKTIPGKSVFMVPVERIAHFITFYSPVKSKVNVEGVSQEDLDYVVATYSPQR